jgi:NAD-dependent dihydropyrimidine dehydrogenase PreA subunit
VGAQPVYHRITARLNHTALRPRPVVDPAGCTGCGDCARGCPVGCISAGAGRAFRINLSQCVDCGCCIKTCDMGAVQLQFVGFSRLLRLAMNRPITPLEARTQGTLDPSPRN